VPLSEVKRTRTRADSARRIVYVPWPSSGHRARARGQPHRGGRRPL